MKVSEDTASDNEIGQIVRKKETAKDVLVQFLKIAID